MNKIAHLLTAVLIVLFGITATAQEVTYSPYEKFDNRDDAYTIVGMTGGYVYTYIKNTENARLDAYDEKMDKKATVILDFFPSRIHQVKFISYPDKIMVLYQALEGNKVVQYVAMLDGNGLLINKPLEIGSNKMSLFGATRTYFSASISDDKKTILIYSATDKKNKIEFDGTWLDDNGKITRHVTTAFETENLPEHGEVNVGNDGGVYMAAYTPTGQQDYADQYWLLILEPGKETFKSKELSLGERYATGGYSKIDNINNKVYFGGFYSDTKNGSFSGFIYAAYDIATEQFSSQRYIPFDNNLRADMGSRRRNSIFDNFMVRQLIVKNDGGFVLIAEIQFVTTRSQFTPGFGYYSFYNPSRSSSVREYHYNDIMTLAYDKDGKREWGTFIPKQQYSQEDDGAFSSYALLNSGGSLAFLYNDFNERNSRIQIATLTPEGKSESRQLTTEGNDYPDWIPRSAKQVAGRVMIVPCYHKRQICFARVTF